MIECVPNFSDGRNPETADAIARAITSVDGAILLGRESDADHNRSVFTIVGPAASVLESAIRAAVAGAARIDLRSHHGVHPRIGAADVIPFIPLADATMDQCVELAREAAASIWKRAGVPSYLYEFAALRPERRNLEAIRKIGFESLRDRVAEFPPDVGGPRLHPSAGACAVGARRILVACNVNLESANIDVARRIARAIRASSGGFPYVKALGLELSGRGLVQVSMNLTHYEATPLARVFARICELADLAGVRIHSTEIIGFPPRASLDGAGPFLEICERWTPQRILENRIAQFTGSHPQSADSTPG